MRCKKMLLSIMIAQILSIAKSDTNLDGLTLAQAESVKCQASSVQLYPQ
jgi:hypothetical protein